VHADVDLDAVALLVLELVPGRAAVVGRDRVARGLRGEAGLRAARADHLLDRLEHVAEAHAGSDVRDGPLAAVARDPPGAPVAIEGMGIHEKRAFYATTTATRRPRTGGGSRARVTQHGAAPGTAPARRG